MSMAPGSPSVQSSSFNSYSSGPASAPGGSTSGVGTTEWFKEHALLILLGVVALVAILWYLSRRGSSGATLSPDTGYPLGYPSVSGGSGASSGGAGAADTGTAATTDTTSALDAFVKGFQLRDGQVQPQGTSSITDSHNTTNYSTTPNPISPNTTTNNYYQPAAVTAPPPPRVPPPPPIRPQIQKVDTTAKPLAVATGTTSQSLGVARAGLTNPAAINNILQGAFTQAGMGSKASTGTHAATTTPKPTPKKAPTKKATPIGHTKGHEGVY